MVLLEWRILSQPCPFQPSGDDGHFDSVASADFRQPISWYCWCKKSQTTTWDLQNLVNNGRTLPSTWWVDPRNFSHHQRQQIVSSLEIRGRSLAIRGWQALGPHRASFAGGATVDVTSGYVWDPPDRLQVRLDRRSTTTRHKNLLQTCGVWSKIIALVCLLVFVLFFVVFRKLLFCNIKPFIVSKCSNRIICVLRGQSAHLHIHNWDDMDLLPWSPSSFDLSRQKSNSHVPWVRLVG